MQSKVKFKFDPDTKIFYKCTKGVVTLADVKRSWKEVVKKDLMPDSIAGFILDYREAHFEMDCHDFEKVGKYFNANKAFFKGKQIAVITSDPKDIVLPMLLEKMHNCSEVHPFTTMTAAIEWLKKFS